MFCLECGHITSNPKFCNRSCAAIYNNRKYPKRELLPNKFCKCGNRKSGSAGICKKCTKDSPDVKRLKRRALRIKRYSKVISEWIERLGGKCVQCSTTEDLEFDHIDPSKKEYNVSKILDSYPKEKLEEEFSKCQLLCNGCHKEKNKIDNGEAKHGSLSMYVHYKCRCDLCRKASSDYRKIYAARSSSGKNTGL